MYTTQWTQFETQSLAFSILRKQLYPDYLVRGDFGEIRIYQPTVDKTKPIHLLTLKVQPSMNPENQGFQKLSEKEYLLIGGNEAYKVVDHIKPLL